MARWLKFTGLRAIEARERTIKAFIKQAIKPEKATVRIEFEAKREPVLADETKQAFAAETIQRTTACAAATRCLDLT